MNETEPQIVVEKLDMGYGSFILMRNQNFSVNRVIFSSLWEEADAERVRF
jgi:hypothetical protein